MVVAIADDFNKRFFELNKIRYMKRWISFIVAMMCCLSLSAGVYNPDNIPIPETGENPSYISDPDSILSDSISDVINWKLLQLEKKTNVKTLVIVVEHIEGDDPYEFSMTVGNKYGIGSKADNKGLIITLATLDRSCQILTGTGLEGDLPDAICYRIVTNVLNPRARQSQWDKAVKETVDAVCGLLSDDIDERMRIEKIIAPKKQNDSISVLDVVCSLLGCIFFIPFLLGLFWMIFKLTYYILLVPNEAYLRTFTHEEKKSSAELMEQISLHFMNTIWNMGDSFYFEDENGEKVFFVDNRIKKDPPSKSWEMEWNTHRFIQIFVNFFNMFFDLGISLYYVNNLGEKTYYLDNRIHEFTYSGVSRSSDDSSSDDWDDSRHSSRSSSHDYDSDSSRDQDSGNSSSGSRGGGRFGGGGYGGRF